MKNYLKSKNNVNHVGNNHQNVVEKSSFRSELLIFSKNLQYLILF